ncbi:MAG: hypothetical protein ACE5HV_00305 [Acidobacteriota bacterium]
MVEAAEMEELQSPVPVPLRGTSTFLLGEPGAGKTWALTTLVEAGLELAVIITDPGGEESLLDAMRERDLPMDKLHWNYIPPASPSWEVLQDMAFKIGEMSYEGLSGIKTGISKHGYKQFYQLLSTLANFKDERTGEELGPVDAWGPDRALAIDSTSGVNVMALDMMLGAKPAAHQGEWGVAMNAEEKLFMKLCSDLRCFLVITAHIEKEPDLVTGVPLIMAGLLGRKLAPKLPRLFSDVVLAYKEGSKFYWSTVAANVALKSRALPLRDKLDPSFGQVVEVWKKRNELAEVPTPTSEEG